MIIVIAGVNGAGKSSVLGSYIRASGGNYFNPDEVTRSLMVTNPTLTLTDANAQAWNQSFANLKDAIANDQDYTFETTLGGRSISATLLKAAEQGIQVQILFVGLDSPEKHIARVAARVANGGHDIPEEQIRKRWHGAITNLMALIPVCSAVSVFDNSAGLVNGKPSPVQLFSLVDGEFTVAPTPDMPDWAKPLALVAIKLSGMR